MYVALGARGRLRAGKNWRIKTMVRLIGSDHLWKVTYKYLHLDCRWGFDYKVVSADNKNLAATKMVVWYNSLKKDIRYNYKGEGLKIESVDRLEIIE